MTGVINNWHKKEPTGRTSTEAMRVAAQENFALFRLEGMYGTLLALQQNVGLDTQEARIEVTKLINQIKTKQQVRMQLNKRNKQPK